MPSVTKLISDQVEAATVDASGLDPAAVHPLPSPAAPLSQSRTRRAGQRRRPRRALDAGDATYGAVFDFGILSATSPTGAMLSPRTPRVQRPAGPFYYLEVTAAAFGLTELFARMDTPERRPVHRRPVPRRAHQPGTRLRQPVAHLRRQRLPRVASPGRHKPAAGGHCRSVDRTPTNGHPRETRQPYVGR